MSVSTPPITDPTLGLLPLYGDQTEAVLLARWIDWANEGLDPVADADRWVDTRELGHWRMCVTPALRECARLYDLIGTEVPMSAFVIWAWGSYLDQIAVPYLVERLPATAAQGVESFSGPAGSVITAGTVIGTVPVTPDSLAQSFRVLAMVTIPDLGGGVGTIDADIQAVNAGAAGDVAAGAITVPSTPLPAGVTATNATPTQGGSDVESDELLRTRLLQAMAGRGPGTVADYIRWASAWPGVGRVKVVPVWTGPGTVLVDIEDVNGLPLPSGTVTGLQDELDPVAGQGAGIAPVGAAVTVDTSTLLNIIVAATVTYKTGYSSDGTGNTIALHDPIAAGISAYLLTVQPGDHVIYAHIGGIIATWPGVLDVSGLTVNSGVLNVAVGLSPPQAPVLASLAV